MKLNSFYTHWNFSFIVSCVRNNFKWTCKLTLSFLYWQNIVTIISFSLPFVYHRKETDNTSTKSVKIGQNKFEQSSRHLRQIHKLLRKRQQSKSAYRVSFLNTFTRISLKPLIAPQNLFKQKLNILCFMQVVWQETSKAGAHYIGHFSLQ